MTDDLSELKRLAEAVRQIRESEIDAYTMGALTVKARFYDATDPSAILALIARVEKAEAEQKRWERLAEKAWARFDEEGTKAILAALGDTND